MNKCIKLVLPIASLMMFSVNIFAENIVVYRWVDKNNVVHFSQNQPEHDDYVELTMTNAPRVNDQKDLTELNLKGKNTNQLIDLKEKCDTATANLRTLKAFNKIQFTNDKGETKVLSEEEKNQQLELNQKQVEVYCAKP
jgi:hypothetical protein